MVTESACRALLFFKMASGDDGDHIKDRLTQGFGAADGGPAAAFCGGDASGE